jgi:hypothetical protein
LIIDRILQLIEYKKISKNRFYKETGLSNGFLDKVKDVGASKVEYILDAYPDVNPIWLLTGRGTMLVDDIKTEVSEPGFVYENNGPEVVPLYDENETEIFTNKNGNKFYIYADNTIKIEIPLMTEPAYAGYVEAYFDNHYLENLPTSMFTVDKIGKGNYMAFTVKNNSMWNGGGYDTPGGAVILGREIGRHLWHSGFRKTDYGFILLTKTGIYHKDIKSYNPDTGILVLSSRNPENKDFEISINDVNKVFNVIKRAY